MSQTAPIQITRKKIVSNAPDKLFLFLLGEDDTVRIKKGYLSPLDGAPIMKYDPDKWMFIGAIDKDNKIVVACNGGEVFLKKYLKKMEGDHKDEAISGRAVDKAKKAVNKVLGSLSPQVTLPVMKAALRSMGLSDSLTEVTADSIMQLIQQVLHKQKKLAAKTAVNLYNMIKMHLDQIVENIDVDDDPKPNQTKQNPVVAY